MRKFTCLVLAAAIGLTMLSFSACAGAEKKATSLSLSSAELCVNAGEDAKLTATVDEAAAQKGVNWSSANEQIATVSEDGTIKGVSFGRTMITAKTVDGSALTESCEVTVTNDSGAMDTADVIVKQDLSDYPELEGQAASSATLTFHADKSCEIDAFYGGLAIAAVKYKTTYSVEDGVLTFAEQGVPVNVLFFSSEAYTVAQVRGDKVVIEITVGDTLCATFIMDEAAALSHGIYVGKNIPVTGIEAEEEIVISANSTVDVSDLVRVLPENATEKGITVEMVQNNAPDILSLSGTQITAKALEGDCRLRATTVEGNFSVEFTVKAVIRPDDFPEDYYKDSGAKGTLEKELPVEMEIKQEGDQIVVTRPNDLKRMKSLHGLTRTLINNMVVGVTEGYKKVLEVNGVGYRAAKSGNKLTLSLGYSHPVEMIDPEGVETVLEGQNKITVQGIDKEKVGQYAAEIRDKRRPEPYKGKGIKYADEVIRRKVGKTGKK